MKNFEEKITHHLRFLDGAHFVMKLISVPSRRAKQMPKICIFDRYLCCARNVRPSHLHDAIEIRKRIIILHSERPKLYVVLAVLSVVGL